MSLIEKNLSAAGFSLSSPIAPVASYVPYTIAGKLVIISGQISMTPDGLITGHLGQNLSIEEGTKAAEVCALNILSQLKVACEGELNRIETCLRLGGFVAATADFTDHPKVINGASDLIGIAMGNKGRHARAAVGVASLPLGAAVEVEAMFELK